MELDRELAEYCLSALQEAGAEKAQCILRVSEKSELNVASAKISLLRTTQNAELALLAILQDKKAALTINETSRPAIELAAKEVVELARISQPDPANDIAEATGGAQSFESGPSSSDLELMYDRVRTFLDELARKYPLVGLEEMALEFTRVRKLFLNSNKVDFTENEGLYRFVAMFTSKEGEKSSSFNAASYCGHTLDREIFDYGSVERLIRQNSEQITTRAVEGKFTGDVIITPDCLCDFLSTLTGYLGDFSMMTGNSIYKDSIGSRITSPSFSLHSRPVSGEVAAGYFVTRDGYRAEDCCIIENGILRTHLLGLYASNKTGRKRAVNNGGCYVVDPGEKSFDDMVKNVKRGILLCRFSGGNPSDNGDFSGVAKNSYYIEDGEINYPISETMLSGNIAEMLQNIAEISKERVDFGTAKLPWITVGGLLISGS